MTWNVWRSKPQAPVNSPYFFIKIVYVQLKNQQETNKIVWWQYEKKVEMIDLWNKTKIPNNKTLCSYLLRRRALFQHFLLIFRNSLLHIFYYFDLFFPVLILFTLHYIRLEHTAIFFFFHFGDKLGRHCSLQT